MWWATVRTPGADAEIRARVARHLDEHAAALSRHAQVDEGDFDTQLRLGLDLVLDGITTRLRPEA
jgi:hypothetical protein